MASTRYVVLRADDESAVHFSKVGEVDASSASSAIQKALSNGEGSIANGFYTATPTRSFQIVPVSVKVIEPQIVVGSSPSEPVAEKKKVAVAASEMRRELDRDELEDPVLR